MGGEELLRCPPNSPSPVILELEGRQAYVKSKIKAKFDELLAACH
jgi:hypothetical protein